MPPKKRILTSIVFFAAFAAGSFGLELVMEWRVGSDRVLFEERILPTETGYTVELRTSAGEYDELVLDRSRSTLRWLRRVESEGTELRAERRGASVRVAGKYRGADYDRTFDLGNLPWYQIQEASYENLLPERGGIREFWTIDRKNLRASRFRAEPRGEETIGAMGNAVQALRYDLTVQGVPAFLFTSQLWLRVGDGRFLRLEVPAILGLPSSSVELIQEKP